MNEIRHMVIPAAGLGRRMAGAIPGIPGHFPKEMLPIGGRAAIQHVVLDGFNAGIRDFTIIIRRGKEIIRTLFEKGEYPGGMKDEHQNELDAVLGESRFHFIEQEQLDGECGAIFLAREVVEENPFAVVYPDNVCRPSGVMKRLIDAFAKAPADLVALMQVNDENKHCISNSGRIDLEDFSEGNRIRLKTIHAKEEGHFEPRHEGEMRTCGMYIALPHYFDFIEKGLAEIGRQELSDGMVRRAMLEADIPIYGLPIAEEVHDTGNPEGFWRCAQEFARTTEE